MADKTINQLTEDASPTSDDFVPTWDVGTGTTKKVSLSNVVGLYSGWWQELGRTTLSVGGDVITVSGLAAKKFLRIIIFTTATGGSQTQGITFNNDTAANYSRRVTIDDTQSTAVSQTSITTGFSGTAVPLYTVIDVINFTANEKLCQAEHTSQSTAGAATAPSRSSQVFKWANTAAQITRVDCTNVSTGDYASGSVMVVLGHD